MDVVKMDVVNFGLRQVYENVLQLRGDAGERQVPDNPKVTYTHLWCPWN